ncbi:low molecular weight protein-tyrosine-phosphatase, partial [Streptomyces sparsus]
GNICRSPVAESVFRAEFAKAGLDGLVTVDSAGTGDWHVGSAADPRAAASLTGAGYDARHTARCFDPAWFERLDLVVALDRGHQRALRRMAPSAGHAAKVRLLRSYDPDAQGDEDVPDPYYGGPDGFTTVLAMVERAVPGLLDAVRKELEES